MKVNCNVLFVLAAAFALAPISCGPMGGASGSLEPTLPDVDDDGLLELPPPEGIPVGTGEIGIQIINRLTESEITALLPPAISGIIGSDLVDATVRIEVEFTYANGESLTHSESKPLRDFTFGIETACSDSVIATIDAVFDILFLGEQTIPLAEFEVTQVEGGGLNTFACDQIIRLEVFLDEAGQVQASLTVEDQEQ